MAQQLAQRSRCSEPGNPPAPHPQVQAAPPTAQQLFMWCAEGTGIPFTHPSPAPCSLPPSAGGSDPTAQQFFIQFVTRYLHDSGVMRCRVTTITRR